MRLTWIVFVVGCGGSASGIAPAHGSTGLAAPSSALVYKSMAQPCGGNEHPCGDIKPGDPCTVDGSRCVRSCGTDVLVCSRPEPAKGK